MGQGQPASQPASVHIKTQGRELEGPRGKRKQDGTEGGRRGVVEKGRKDGSKGMSGGGWGGVRMQGMKHGKGRGRRRGWDRKGKRRKVQGKSDG